jgi:hypothetical protein
MKLRTSTKSRIGALCAVVALFGCATDDRLAKWGAAAGSGAAGAAAGSAAGSAGDAAGGSGATGGAARKAATPCTPDETAPVPEDRCSTDPKNSSLPTCGTWLKVAPEGAECSNGSQYKFFVNYSNTSNNLLVMFEPGGACWDFESCSGAARGAANPNGIPDDHMIASNYQFLNLVQRSDQNPVRDWNLVFVSYCTGDVHAGNKVATYSNPNGGPALTYRHVGHANTLSVVDWLKTKFTTVPKLLVTGCSAGGIGALQNYFFLREGLTGAQCGYLLDDSGPAFHSDGPSKQLHAMIRSAWNLDATLDELKGKVPVDVEDLKKDFGLVNTALADKYPHDRLSLSVFRMDFNYSLYSYERFFPGSDEAKIHELWGQDLDKLVETFKSRPNLAYYVPYFRRDNCSHCVSIPPIDHPDVALTQSWLGSEIEQDHINLRDFTETLLDDTRPLVSYRESDQADEKFTSEELALCLMPE